MVVGLKNREILLPEMRVARLATVECKEKREVSVVGVEEIEITQVEREITRNRREKCIQQVVVFFVKLRVMDAEYFVELRACSVHFRRIEIVNDYSERELAEVISAKLNFLNAFPEFAYLRLL